MVTLKGEHIYLRALEPEDLEFIHTIENDENFWEISSTQTPYSKFLIKQYLDNAHKDIYEVKQLRLVICVSENDKAIGFIDLFDFDPKNQRVGIGIVIFSEKDRQKGYASHALQVLCAYTFTHLGVHQLYANITEDNAASIQLFEKLGFVKAGIKKDWIHTAGSFKDEFIYQYFNEEH